MSEYRMQRTSTNSGQKSGKKKSKNRHMFFTYLLILAVLGYLIGQFINFLNDDSTNYIVASQGEIVDAFSTRGVIVRDEILVKSSTGGFVEYYYPGGKELKQGTKVCSILNDYYGDILQQKIDEIYSQIADEDSSGSEYNEAFESLDTSISQTTAQYLRNKSNSNYNALYALKTDLADAVSQRKDMYSLMGNTKVTELLAEQNIYLNEQQNILSDMYLPNAGLLDYSYDGYEGWTVDQIGSDFLESYDGYYSYFEINLQSIKAGTPLYRLVYSSVWNIVVFLTEEEAKFFDGEDTVDFIYNSSDKLTGRVTTLEQTGYDEYKLVLKVNERIQDFMNDRIATVVFNKNSHSGIKISDSCLVQESYFVIPKKYLMQSGNDYGMMVVSGEDTKFQKINVIDTDEEVVYYSLPEGVSPVQTIQMQDSLETMVTGATGSLYGVYVVNGGYEQFESVKVKYQGQGYSLVEGIQLYDRVKVNRD